MARRFWLFFLWAAAILIPLIHWISLSYHFWAGQRVNQDLVAGVAVVDGMISLSWNSGSTDDWFFKPQGHTEQFMNWVSPDWSWTSFYLGVPIVSLTLLPLIGLVFEWWRRRARREPESSPAR